MRKLTALLICACIAVSAAFGKEDCDKAMADYNQQIRIDPDIIYTHNNRAYTYLINGEYDRGARRVSGTKIP